MNDYQARAERILHRIEELAVISEDSACLTRRYGTPAFLSARNKIEGWMRESGLATFVDHIGNIRGKINANPKAKTFVIGSHIDTVVNAGKFDGPLGVLVGLDLMEQVKKAGIEIPFELELIGFCDEEGVRFHSTFLGSRAVAGSFENSLLEVHDESGIKLRDAIRQIGGNPSLVEEDAIPADNWLGYFEIHIEQGPVLYDRKIPVGLVSSIAGQCRAGIIIKGEAGHAGTVPMSMRKDALAGAAEFILTAEKFAANQKEKLLVTVGKLHVINPASNVIPGEVICSLDLRSEDQDLLMTAHDSLKKSAEEICRRRNIELEWNLIQQTRPVRCDDSLNRLLEESIRDAGHEPLKLMSGAGHDAVPISAVAPVTMLFVRCYKGISHHPAEDVTLEDLTAALEVSDNFIKKLLSRHQLFELNGRIA